MCAREIVGVCIIVVDWVAVAVVELVVVVVRAVVVGVIDFCVCIVFCFVCAVHSVCIVGSVTVCLCLVMKVRMSACFPSCRLGCCCFLARCFCFLSLIFFFAWIIFACRARFLRSVAVPATNSVHALCCCFLLALHGVFG